MDVDTPTHRGLTFTMTSTLSPATCPDGMDCNSTWSTIATNITMAPDQGNSTNGTRDYACWFMEESSSIMTSHMFLMSSSLIFFIIGLVGNFFSILVFTSREMRVMSSNVYLLVLALSDSFYLISVFLTKTSTVMRCVFFPDFAMDIFNQHNSMCIFLQYMLDLFSDFSTCLILAFTIERYVAVYLPIRFKEVCTVARARMSCVAIFLVVALGISPYHIMYMGRLAEFNVCTIIPKTEHIFSICYVVEVFVLRIIPVIIIAILNGFIIIKVTKVTRAKRKKKAIIQRNAGNNNKKSKRAQRQDKSLQLTLMLILVSTSYIITYIPVLIHFIMWALERVKMISVPQKAFYVAQDYTSSLYISGFAINFFLYTMSGRVFRDQLELILCNSIRKDYRNGHTTYTEVPADKTSLV